MRAKFRQQMFRIFRVRAKRSESSVWIQPVFARLNGRFGENYCAAEIPVLRSRTSAALAKAAGAKVRVVRES